MRWTLAKMFFVAADISRGEGACVIMIVRLEGIQGGTALGDDMRDA